jgi:hypothetical protein
MKRSVERKRKSKGSLSVLDDFTGETGSISFVPNISHEVQVRIDAKTKLADAPASEGLIYKQEDSELLNNLGQSSDNPKTEPRTNIGQGSNILRTILGQSSDKKQETSDNPKTEPRTKPRTILGQSSDNLRTISAFQALSGLQKNISLLIYEICRLKGGRLTGPVAIEHLYQQLNSTRLSVQKSIQRLEQKQIIIRRESRSGRGGWTVYELPESVWNQILQTESSDKLRTNLGQTSDNPKTEPKTEPRTTAPSSSRVLNLKNSTTTSVLDISAINVSSVFQHGITHSVLSRCIELYPNLEFIHLEALVARFAEFIKDPKNRVQNARGFFISLAEQASKGQVPLDHIETPDERLMREYILQQEQAKQRRSELEQKAQEFEFETWAESLSSDDKLSLVPENSILKLGTAPYAAMLKRHFAESVWPERKRLILEAALSGRDA